MNDGDDGDGTGRQGAPRSASACNPQKPDAETESHTSPQLARSLHATKLAWDRMEAEFGLLTDNEAAKFLGVTSPNLIRLRNSGRIIAVERGPSIRYPGFQFDRASRAILPVIKPLVEVARENGWSNESLTLWMLGPTTSFDAEDRPADHLNEPELLLAAARSHMEALW
ncbi:helix-turn-helix domain-containing protein [Cryobacterium sp. 1639]|uniref:helix-turn-helix domain-containing protein n=1 Tax=Cryobacterium inferilacus TaxID=2866629 RepID=UPI001C732533|nr:helix-turn-helix domain-containing protein [Cryobacterium sp. 1639]MBX0299381.1 helix-turn-helix domain-containing protein [Cryobacterium sp. 1639]